jgi:hypothetical protein
MAARARAAFPVVLLAAALTFAACSDDTATATAPRVAPAHGRADVAPIAIDSFNLLSDSIPGTYSGTGWIILHAAAPAGGAKVVVTSSNSSIGWAVPDTVVVPAGAISNSFTVATQWVPDNTRVTLTATYLGQSRMADFVVKKTFPPDIEVYPRTLDYGQQAVGTVSPQQVFVENSGSGPPLFLGAMSVTGPFTLQSSNCPAILVHVGDYCSVWVSFAPTFAGLQSGSLLISNNSPNSPAAMSLSGTAYVPVPPVPGASVTPTSIGFGSLRIGLATSGRTITLTSTGTGPLVVSSVNLGGNTYDFWLGNDGCSGVTLQHGASCTVAVSFEPTHLGSRAATVTFVHNAGASSVVSLSGTGLKPGAYIP